MVRIIRGESVKLGDDEFSAPDILTEIKEAMEQDPEDPEALSADLLQYYASLESHHRDVVNQTLIHVCGYGLRTLLLSAVADEGIFEPLGFEPPGEEQIETNDEDDDE